MVVNNDSANVENVDEKTDLWANTLVVIVLYKIPLCESPTYISLEKSISACFYPASINLLICDNSPIEQTNINHDNKFFNIWYLHDLSNPGVSQPYNRAAELAGVQGKKWLLVLDQDTWLPEDTIRQYQQAVTDFPNFPIYAPQIYSGSLLFSPCLYRFKKGMNLSSIKPGIHLMKNKNILNSGLLICLRAFYKAGGYDEAVQLYFSDFVFFDRLKTHFREFIVIDCHLNHQLSSVDYTNIETALDRFTKYCIGARSASRSNNSLIAHLNYTITIGLRSIIMCLRFNNLIFIKVFIDYYLRK